MPNKTAWQETLITKNDLDYTELVILDKDYAPSPKETVAILLSDLRDAIAGVIDITIAELQDVDNPVLPNRWYRVTDSAVADGPIIFRSGDTGATPENGRVVKAIALFFDPDYQNTLDWSALVGASMLGVWRSTLSPAAGDVVIWNGINYINLTGAVGTLPDGDPTNWDAMTSDETNCIETWDAVEYDWRNDWLISRSDKRGNVVSASKAYAVASGLLSPAETFFQWGNDLVTGNRVNEGVIYNLNSLVAVRSNTLVNSVLHAKFKIFGSVIYNTLINSSIYVAENYLATERLAVNNNYVSEGQIHMEGTEHTAGLTSVQYNHLIASNIQGDGCDSPLIAYNRLMQSTLQFDAVDSFAATLNNMTESIAILDGSDPACIGFIGNEMDSTTISQAFAAACGMSYCTMRTNQDTVLLPNNLVFFSQVIDFRAHINTFHGEADLTGSNVLDLNSPNLYYAGVILITSSNATEDLDLIVNAGPNSDKFGLKIVPDDGLTLTVNSGNAAAPSATEIITILGAGSANPLVGRTKAFDYIVLEFETDIWVESARRAIA